MRNGPPKIPRPMWQMANKNMYEQHHVRLVKSNILVWCMVAILIASSVIVFLIL